MKTLNPIHADHEKVYNHFVDRQENGQFDRYNADMQSFINRVWNKNLGVVAAMSHSGIGADVSNGFVQFVADNPSMMVRLIGWLTEVRDALPKLQQPTVEIRSKTTPNHIDDATHYLTVMFRTPRFKTKDDANTWWSKLVQSYN
ncbi:hypothetical protein ST201phi2-1p428 [Pseudomonas phage 201phi2-1]|uniref:Uncharacterized protein n=1 Tax=Pseudomonas phage 201phi2-1 TaxID=198110 RepID=B3FJT6_BP201|nr:hypothetical protein ST201phi2-1p428 [Pseudomonas phage 201phi2-1]ABY63251.1 hypothetical protein 201phi2-1p428 [Pseudomonas phage 201phi2-1]